MVDVKGNSRFNAHGRKCFHFPVQKFCGSILTNATDFVIFPPSEAGYNQYIGICGSLCKLDKEREKHGADFQT